MNKKIMSLVVAGMVACGMAYAQQLPQRVQGNPNQRNDEQLSTWLRLKMEMKNMSVDKDKAPSHAPEVQWRAADLVEQSKTVYTEYQEDDLVYVEPKAPVGVKNFYWKPDGTLFIGPDRGLAARFQGVIGAWMNDLDAWEFPFHGTIKEKTDLTYASYYSLQMNGKTYGTNKTTGAWTDTAVAVLRGNPAAYYSYDMPHLVIDNGPVMDTFVLATDSKNYNNVRLPRSNYNPPTYFEIGAAATMAGAQYPVGDGMWPMTNALTLDCNLGTLTIDSLYNKEKVEYFIGTSDVTAKNAQGADVTVTPAGVVVAYQKPQSALFVKDITLWLNAFDNTGKVTAPQLDANDTLYISIETEKGEVVARSAATVANLTQVKANAQSRVRGGAVLKFEFNSDTTQFGEQRSVGFAVEDAFTVAITGLDKCKGNFGIVTAYAPYGSNAKVITKDAKYVSYAQVEPYLMLNGIYPTLFNAYTNVEDTLEIRDDYEMGDGSLRSVAVFDRTQGENSSMYNYVPAIFSYYYPVDTLKQTSNFELVAPEWIETFGFDDSDWAGETYTDMLYLYFFAAPLPDGVTYREGDITLTSYGKSRTYFVMQGEKKDKVEVPTAVEDAQVSLTRVSAMDGVFHLTYTEDFKAVEVYSINGIKVAAYELPVGGTFDIPNTELSNGMYIFRMIGAQPEVLRSIK